MQRTKIATVTGQPIVYLQPELTQIIEEDLFVSLSNQSRYAGHTRNRVSILLHLALITRLFERACMETGSTWPEKDWFVLRRAIMSVHDMPEAYTGELTTGLKQVLPDYKPKIEIPWERHVFRHFGLPFPDDDAGLKEILTDYDLRALCTEGWATGHVLYEEMQKHGGPVRDYEKRAWEEVSYLTDEDQWQLVWTSAMRTRPWPPPGV